MRDIIRCKWCLDGGINQEYHDKEWGIPVHDDRKHFEFISMEVMQCGLNWTMMLKKRDTFKECFDNFDFYKIVNYDEAKIESIMATPNMIRSRRKIQAIINNAKRFVDIIDEFGSFDKYIWSFTGGKTMIYINRGPVAKNELSDTLSKDLKKRGLKYMGSITVYAHLQASGIINDHEHDCWMYKKLIEENTNYLVVDEKT